MIIYKKSFAGGAGLTPKRGQTSPNTLARALRDVADDLAACKTGAIAAADIAAVASADIAAVAAPAAAVTAVPDVAELSGVADGLICGAPTTPSSQAVDPGGFTDWNINISAGYVFVNEGGVRVGGYFAAQVDFDVSSGVKILEIGEAVYAWIVAASAAGVVTQVQVLGVAGLLGAELVPDDAAITAGVGHADWTKIALIHASRTADAVVATTEDPSLMSKWGGGATNLANDLKAKYNVAVTAILELRTLAGTVRTLLNEVKTVANTVRTLANEVKTDLNLAGGAVTLKTTKG